MSEKFISELITSLVIFFLFLILLFFVVITLIVRYRKRKKENEELRVQFSEQLLSAQLEIQEQTLQHISRELHDNLGQIASLIKINLSTIRLEQPEKAIVKIDDTKELVKQLVTDMKLLSTSLNGDKMSKVGLMRALQNESDRINKTGVFRSVFVQNDHIPPINDEKSIIIYRMVQECLNNALKHSEATEINMEANYQKNRFILTVEDNGIGFDVAEKLADLNDTGNGLLNLQKRAAVINGTINFVSVTGKGTKTTITTNL